MVCLPGGRDGWSTDLRVNFLQRVKEGDEGRTTKVSDGAQASKEAAVPHLLKVALTHILHIGNNSFHGRFGKGSTNKIRTKKYVKYMSWLT